MQHTCMVQWHVDGRPLVSAETECRSQPTFEAWDLLRSHSFFLHSYFPFPSRESGHRLSILAGASGLTCTGSWNYVCALPDAPISRNILAFAVMQSRERHLLY